MSRLPTIAICGPGRAGKDTAGNYLASITSLRRGPSTSEIIAPHVAKRLGQTVRRAFSERHENRELWFQVGNELRANDSAYLVKESLKEGEIVVGLRNLDEVMVAREQGLIDLFVYLLRSDRPEDSTMKFGASACDIVITNNGTEEEFCAKIRNLARFARLV